ncbi:MAG: peptidoglycan-binding protein [Clostridiales bacterium]|nr:peptidoglycan-binding protein [Clostridiales bacterium]
MNDFVIAIGGADAGETPFMPFVGKRFDGVKCAAWARLMLEIALLRCGFDVYDRHTPVTDTQELILQSNRHAADCIVVLSCGAFGSRKSFNDVRGSAVKYSPGRFGAKSREIAEDVCAKVKSLGPCSAVTLNNEFNGAACPVIVINMGYLTNFDEAKLLFDLDYIHNIAEYAAMGICEYFGMPYIPLSPAAYARFNVKPGMRGKNVKLLQAALILNGYPVVIDGVYGKSTEIAVKEFYINNGGPDNILHDLLFVAPCELPSGSKHNGVLYLQRKLISKLYSSPDSGTLNEDTISAVSEFLTDTENTQYISNNGITKEAFKLLAEIGGGRPRLF